MPAHPLNGTGGLLHNTNLLDEPNTNDVVSSNETASTVSNQTTTASAPQSLISSTSSAASSSCSSPSANLLPNLDNTNLTKANKHDSSKSASMRSTASPSKSILSTNNVGGATPKRTGSTSSTNSNPSHSANLASNTPSKSTSNQQPASNSSDTNNSESLSSDDQVDEVKVYQDEGAPEEEHRKSENLDDEKTDIIKENSEDKPSQTLASHPFSVNNLMLYTNAAAAAASAKPFNFSDPSSYPLAAAFGMSAFNRTPLYNPAAALYSPEIAHHFAAWWPAAAAGAALYQHNPFNPFAAAAAANYSAQHQAAAAAALAASRFSPSLFGLPPPPKSASPSSSSSSSTNPLSHSSSSSSSSSSSHSSNPHNNNNNGSNISYGGQSFSRFNNNGAMPVPNHSNGQSNAHNMYNSQNNGMTPSSKIKKEKMHQFPNGGGPNPMNHHSQSHNPNMPNGSNGMPMPPQQVAPSKPKKPHIKKPLNAFMLFMKEQRSQVVSECTLRESAAINQILGRKWHELERSEQAKYYEMARQERLKHMQLYPGWSARDNYGLKKKRRRKREKVIGENGELPRKCRARYGLHQLNLWCKPCRRKKKCIRFAGLEENQNQNMMNNGSGGMVMGPNGQMYPAGNGFGNGGMNDQQNGANSGSMNGGNSDDDYDDYDDDDMEDDDDDDDDDHDDDLDENDDENHEDKDEHQLPPGMSNHPMSNQPLGMHHGQYMHNLHANGGLNGLAHHQFMNMNAHHLNQSPIHKMNIKNEMLNL